MFLFLLLFYIITLRSEKLHQTNSIKKILISFCFPEPERLQDRQKAPVLAAAKVRDGLPAPLGGVLLRGGVQHQQDVGDRRVGAELLQQRGLELRV